MGKLTKSLLMTGLWIALLLTVVSISGFFLVWALDSFAKLPFVDGIPIIAALFLGLGLFGASQTVAPGASIRLRTKFKLPVEAVRDGYHKVWRRDSDSTHRVKSYLESIPNGSSNTRADVRPQGTSAHDETVALKAIHSIVWSNSLTHRFASRQTRSGD